MISNNPSLGLYRIQENVHKMLPQLANSHLQLEKENAKIESEIFDVATSIDVVRDIVDAKPTFVRIEQLLAKATAAAALLNMKT